MTDSLNDQVDHAQIVYRGTQASAHPTTLSQNSPLTNQQIDNNFFGLQTLKIDSSDVLKIMTDVEQYIINSEQS